MSKNNESEIVLKSGSVFEDRNNGHFYQVVENDEGKFYVLEMNEKGGQFLHHTMKEYVFNTLEQIVATFASGGNLIDKVHYIKCYETVYSSEKDITFFLEDVWSNDGDFLQTELKGFAMGKITSLEYIYENEHSLVHSTFGECLGYDMALFQAGGGLHKA